MVICVNMCVYICAARGGTWPRGVMVSTLDSESSDRGSNPREAFQECLKVVGILLVEQEKIVKRP